jgi:hypothetical protein
MIDRAGFVGAAAALTAAAAAPANAQTDGFGRPHPPIVPENDPAITVVHASLVRPDATIGAYVAMPRTIAATTPGVVLAIHIWGVDAQYRDLARRFAKLGYIAIVPGLMDRSHVPSGDDTNDSAPFRAAFAQMLAGTTAFGDLLARSASTGTAAAGDWRCKRSWETRTTTRPRSSTASCAPTAPHRSRRRRRRWPGPRASPRR